MAPNIQRGMNLQSELKNGNLLSRLKKGQILGDAHGRPGRKIDRTPARPCMYLKTAPSRPARAEKRKGRPPIHWICVTKRPGGRPPAVLVATALTVLAT